MLVWTSFLAARLKELPGDHQHLELHEAYFRDTYIKEYGQLDFTENVKLSEQHGMSKIEMCRVIISALLC